LFQVSVLSLVEAEPTVQLPQPATASFTSLAGEWKLH
jgi:hypothetical protein